MADVRWGRATWPGIRQVRRFAYTQTRGITPAVIRLDVIPQPGVAFASEGDFTIFDGVGTVTLRRCKFDRLNERRGKDGIIWEVDILDRRWLWRDTGAVKLYANQLDPHGKFVPWTIRSPVEMAQACLNAMGETGYTINLPVGLTRSQGTNFQELLSTGVNFPPTGVNPPVDWYYARPAPVLESLAEQFGRVVCLRWDTDTVYVARKGEGGDLPPGSLNSQSPSAEDAKTPDGVVVAGCPTRYQGEFEVQPVGREWDGTFRPINDLSYAPRGAAGAKHKVRVEGEYDAAFRYYVTVDGVTCSSEGAGSMAAAATALAACLRGGLDFQSPGRYTVTSDGTGLTIEANQQGPQFSVEVRVDRVSGSDPNPPWNAQVLVIGKRPGRNSWANSYPPLFPGVRATARLTLAQARGLARGSVWKYFQLTGRSADRTTPIVVPGYGKIKRRQQVVLLDTQCEQIAPEKPDFNIFFLDGTPWVRVQYDGYSRDKPAVCIGSVAKSIFHGTLFFPQNGTTVFGKQLTNLNTGADDEVPLDFTVEPTYQMIQFPQHVYQIGPGFTLQDPQLILRTAVNVRDPDTNAFAAFERRLYFPGRSGTNLAFERHDDVELNVIGRYVRLPFFGRKLVSTRILEVDPINRADYYLQGMLLRYQVKPSLVNVYNGIVPIVLDGRISQVTWEGGDPSTGCGTTGSINYEHDTAVPPYPARRRDENLRDAAQPGGFLGQVNARQDPTMPAFPFMQPR